MLTRCKNHDGKVLKIPKTFFAKTKTLFFVLEAPRDQHLGGLEDDITVKMWIVGRTMKKTSMLTSSTKITRGKQLSAAASTTAVYVFGLFN